MSLQISADGPYGSNVDFRFLEDFKIQLDQAIQTSSEYQSLLRGAQGNFLEKIQFSVALEKLMESLNTLVKQIRVELVNDLDVYEKLKVNFENSQVYQMLSEYSSIQKVEIGHELSLRSEIAMCVQMVLDPRSKIAQMFQIPQEVIVAAERYNSVLNTLTANIEWLNGNTLKDALHGLSLEQENFGRVWFPLYFSQIEDLFNNPQKLIDMAIRRFEQLENESPSQEEITKGVSYYTKHAPVKKIPESMKVVSSMANSLLRESRELPHREQETMQLGLLEATKTFLEGSEAANSIRPPSLDYLLDNTYGVHATNFKDFLREGKLVPTTTRSPLFDPSFFGVQDDGERTIAPTEKDFRVTLHWSINSLVPAHNGNNGGNQRSYRFDWEKAPIAIVTPFRELMPSLVNVFAYDSFGIGEFDATKQKCAILVSESMNIEDVHPEIRKRVAFYPENQSLREAVDSYLRGSKLKVWETRKGYCGIGGIAMASGDQLNSIDYFKPLLEAYPHLSFGDHFNAIRGKAYLFGVCEQMIPAFIQLISDSSATPKQLRIMYVQIQYYLSLLDEYLVTLPLGESAKQKINDLKFKYDRWMSIFESYMGHISEIGRLVKIDQNALFDAFRLNQLQLKDALIQGRSGDESSDFSEKSEVRYQIIASSLSPQEFDQLLANLQIEERNERREIVFRYAIERVIRSSELDPNLRLLIFDNVNGLLSKKSDEFAQLLWKEVIEENLSIYSSRLQDTLKLISIFEIRPFIVRHYGLERFPLLTLDDIIEQHPKTALAFDDMHLAKREEYEMYYEKFTKGFPGVPEIFREREARKSFLNAEKYCMQFRKFLSL